MFEVREEDLSAPAKIRRAAIESFAEHGVDGTSIRMIASQANVSPSLVIHHFGSKAGLRQSVDDYALDVIRELLKLFGAPETNLDASELFVQMSKYPSLMTYVAQSLVTDGPVGQALFDQMLELGETSFQEMIKDGSIRDLEDPTMVLLFLICAEFGVMILKRHVERFTGVDPMSPAGVERWGMAEFDILRGGIFNSPAANEPPR